MKQMNFTQIESLECRRLCSHYINSTHAYADANFKDSNWEVENGTIGAGGSSSAVQVKKGGHGGPFRSVSTTVYGGASESIVYSFNGSLKSIYDPAKKGAITSINYNEFNKLFAGFGQGQATGAALKQNGILYFATLPFNITPQGYWKKLKVKTLTANNFSTPDLTQHPDFSQTAAPIEFGFFRSNSAGASAIALPRGSTVGPYCQITEASWKDKPVISMRTHRTAQLPLFFTQVIGSLPRPKLLLDLLGRRGEMPVLRYEKLMDEMVIFAIRLQEQAGIDVVSDGEWRRKHYIGEFLERVGGFERIRKFEHQGEIKLTDVVVKKMSAKKPVFVRDAEFLASHTDRATKFALPSPFLIAVRY